MNTSRTIRSFKPYALVIAGVVLGSLFSGMLRPAAALAQNKEVPPDKLLNSAESTKRMADGITQINDRLGRIEAALNAGLKVKVIEMPAVAKDK